jgi:hypothetical protein
MISIALAGALRDAGLDWRPAERDAFALPGRDMDDEVFVVSPLPALVQRVNGYPVVAFQASAEWALDYVMLAEALWLPSESQLREALAESLPSGGELRLDRTAAGYRCAVSAGGGGRQFEAPDAATAYGEALLAVLRGGVPGAG